MRFLREHRSHLLPSFLRAALLTGLLAPALSTGSNPHHLLGVMTAVPIVGFVASVLGLVFGSSWAWRPHLWGLWLTLPLLGFLMVELILLRSPWFEPGWFLLLIYMPAVLAGAVGAVAGRMLAANAQLKLFVFRLAAILTIMLGAISLGLSFQIEPPPVAVAEAFVEAIEANDTTAAYATLHPSLQEVQSLEVFADAVEGALPARGDDGIDWTVYRDGDVATVQSIAGSGYDTDLRFWLALDGYVWKVTGYRIASQSGDVVENGAGQ